MPLQTVGGNCQLQEGKASMTKADEIGDCTRASKDAIKKCAATVDTESAIFPTPYGGNFPFQHTPLVMYTLDKTCVMSDVQKAGWRNKTFSRGNYPSNR